MRIFRLSLALTLAVLGTAAPRTVRSNDVDGPGGSMDFVDFGDAPHSVAAYPDGTTGNFPWVWHVNNYGSWNLWLGGYPEDAPVEDMLGVDTEGPDKTPDCRETAFGMTFDQDECSGDHSDAGVLTAIHLEPCQPATFRIAITTPVAASPYYYLNVLVDYNGDGDWNDTVMCPGGEKGINEWVLKNVEAVPMFNTPGGGYGVFDLPHFPVGPRPGPAWLRISLSFNPVPKDFAAHGGELFGGETEDYPITIGELTPVRETTWGLLKSRYR